MPENHVTAAAFPNFEMEIFSNVFQMAYAPISWVYCHLLDDLNTPPSNHLEKYCGNKKLDKYSIRVNDQWRICFYFRDGDAYEVEIVDYH